MEARNARTRLVVGPVTDALGHVEDDDAGRRVVVDTHPESAQQARP